MHDGLGRRRIERDYAWQGGNWQLTNELHFIYDGYLPVQVRDTNNNVLWTYTRGLDLSGTLAGAGGIGGLLARTDGNGSTFYHADGAGNITGLMDGQQNMAARYMYSAFGRLILQWGPMPGVNRTMFSSKEHLPQAPDIYGFGKRDYFVGPQRWGSQDPIGLRGGLNLYGFVGNNPISGVDPYGLLGWSDFNPGLLFSGTAWKGLPSWFVNDVLIGDTGGSPQNQSSKAAQDHAAGLGLTPLHDANGNLQSPGDAALEVGMAVAKGPIVAATILPLGGEEGAYAAANEALQAARAARLARCNWKSVKQFGHTFTEHGAKRALQELIDRARALGPQGRWLENDKAAEYLSQFQGKLSGPTTIPLPPGLGQIMNADGSVVPAVQAILVPSATGLKTAYPIP